MFGGGLILHKYADTSNQTYNICYNTVVMTREYSRSDIIERIREDSEHGIAPEQEDFTDSRVSQAPITRLFGSYTNAVFMAGKETPRGGDMGTEGRAGEKIW